MAGGTNRGAVIRGMAGIIGVCVACWIPAPIARAGQDDKAPAPASPAPGGLPPELVELVALHNREREAEKLEPLVANARLSAAALTQARDMAEHEKMTHEGSDGSKFNERIERQGYVGRRLAENVAWGQTMPAEVMREWMKSPHHRENILGSFSEIGVAHATSAEGRRYWCATFGLPPVPKLDQGAATAGLVAAVNQARAQAGKPPMRVSPKLSKAAQKVAEALTALGNLDKGETSYAAEVRQAGYRFRLLGEARGSGQPTPVEAVKSWLDDPYNRENFLGRFSDIGTGYAVTEKGLSFWMVFLAVPEK
jgi:uncharacterized protein YkwD